MTVPRSLTRLGMASDLRLWDNGGVSQTLEIVTRQWFVYDDRGYRWDCRDEEDARFEAGKIGHELWSVHSREVRFGPLEDHGTMW